MPTTYIEKIALVGEKVAFMLSPSLNQPKLFRFLHLNKLGRTLGRTSGLLFLAGCQSAPPSSQSSIQVYRVLSGQTIEWIDRTEQPAVIHKGHLIGIDAPDLAQDPWGNEAKQRLEELVGKSGEHHLRVESGTENPDRFGRKFIYLWKDGELVNEQLVKEGYVLANLRSTHPYKNSTSLSNASQYARLMGKGVWNPDRPLRTLPADFRREQR